MLSLQDEVCNVLKTLENCKLESYPDSKGIWTIGVGTIRLPDGTPVKKNDTCTLQEAMEWLNHHLKLYIFPTVDNMQKKYLFNKRIYVALCSLGYNIGSALKGTSIIQSLKDSSIPSLAEAFKKYNKCDGRFNEGLQNRRNIEILYFTTNRDIDKIYKEYYNNI